MSNHKPQSPGIQTDLTAGQILEKLNRVTAEEFHNAIKSQEYKYYGKILDREFDIRNRKYGPHSNGPWLKGKVRGDDNATVIIETDFVEQMEIIKKIMYPYFVFFGLLIMAIGATMEETRLITLAVGAFMIASPFLQVAIIRRLHKSMRKDEIEQFSAMVNL